MAILRFRDFPEAACQILGKIATFGRCAVQGLSWIAISRGALCGGLDLSGRGL
jgi:hypothetical protein